MYENGGTTFRVTTYKRGKGEMEICDEECRILEEYVYKAKFEGMYIMSNEGMRILY